ncbi:hypothetical protein ONZ45_g2287 [Pleurotus djamor]|nr:hypothetical protein ONZ45_g12553 [Pleurotus djamor]KAJ8520924.1 hypothetical protein ONZ45_g2287 [Pleurotus djamor]
MEVVSKRAALLCNYEVLTLLRELEEDHLARAKTAFKVKKEEGASSSSGAAKDVEVSENLRTIEVEAIQYLSSPPISQQSPEGIQTLMQGLAPFNLTKAEKLQIVNIAPQSLPVLWAIVEELEDRMTPEQMEEITTLVQTSLSSSSSGTQPATIGNAPIVQPVLYEDDDAYGEEDGYNDMQFDDTGEGVGVEGDLDVDDD